MKINSKYIFTFIMGGSVLLASTSSFALKNICIQNLTTGPITTAYTGSKATVLAAGTKSYQFVPGQTLTIYAGQTPHLSGAPKSFIGNQLQAKDTVHVTATGPIVTVINANTCPDI